MLRIRGLVYLMWALTDGSGQKEICMTLPGILSRRAGRRAALCTDHFACCNVATSNSTTSLAAFATATDLLSGVKATAVTVLPSCMTRHTCGFELSVILMLLEAKADACRPDKDDTTL